MNVIAEANALVERAAADVRLALLIDLDTVRMALDKGLTDVEAMRGEVTGDAADLCGLIEALEDVVRERRRRIERCIDLAIAAEPLHPDDLI